MVRKRWAVCQRSRTLSDADRLKKYLGKFGLKFEALR